MRQTEGHKVFLDACVIFPAPVRDILLSFAAEGLFIPLWTKEVHEEWIGNLLKKRPDLNEMQLRQTEKAMELAFPTACVTNYEHLIPLIDLPDKDDRHILAAAIQGGAKWITTFNFKDFPPKALNQFNITPIHPDFFLFQLWKTDQETALKGFSKLIKRLKNPPKTEKEVISSLRKCNLPQFSAALEKEYS